MTFLIEWFGIYAENVIMLLICFGSGEEFNLILPFVRQCLFSFSFSLRLFDLGQSRKDGITLFFSLLKSRGKLARNKLAGSDVTFGGTTDWGLAGER